MPYKVQLFISLGFGVWVLGSGFWGLGFGVLHRAKNVWCTTEFVCICILKLYYLLILMPSFLNDAPWERGFWI
jgi:hypothetical protein